MVLSLLLRLRREVPTAAQGRTWGCGVCTALCSLPADLLLLLLLADDLVICGTTTLGDLQRYLGTLQDYENTTLHLRSSRTLLGALSRRHDIHKASVISRNRPLDRMQDRKAQRRKPFNPTPLGT